MNSTMEKFGYPATLIKSWSHWALLLRPGQVTLGSCVLTAKSDATAFGDLPTDAHAELAVVTKALESALQSATGYEKLNYLMLMMVDPHVHFHIIPRYEGMRCYDGVDYRDAGWPGPPDLKSAVTPDEVGLKALTDWLASLFGE